MTMKLLFECCRFIFVGAFGMLLSIWALQWVLFGCEHLAELIFSLPVPSR